MKFNYEEKIVYVRQSWLNDLIICPERARFKLDKPEMSGSTDATIMGTSVHYGIETILGGESIANGIGAAKDMMEQLKQKPFTVTNLDPELYDVHIDSMMQAFAEGILPEVQLGGDIEYQFRFPLGITIGEWDVWCEGTMDYVQPNGVIWDWKTSSRVYYAKEKQAQSIQATVYTAALRHEGKVNDSADFRYGVMVRQEKPKSQVVYMHRNERHTQWLIHNVKPAIQMALSMGVREGNWVMNDTSALCSAKWCSYWSLCKGALLNESDLALPHGGFSYVDLS